MNSDRTPRCLRSKSAKALLILPLALLSMTLGMNAEAQTLYDATKVADNTQAFGLNNSGQVVGELQLTTEFDPFVWSEADGMLILPKPPVPSDISFNAGQAADINDNGSVVGRYFVYGSRGGGTGIFEVPFIYRKAKGTELLETIDDDDNISRIHAGTAFAINDADHVVGYVNELGLATDPLDKLPTYWYFHQGEWVRSIVSNNSAPHSEYGASRDIRNSGKVDYPGFGLTLYPTLMNFTKFIRQGANLIKTREPQGYYWDATTSPIHGTKVSISPSGKIPGWINNEAEVRSMNEVGQVVGTADTWTAPMPGPSPSPSADGGFLYDIGTDTYTPIPWPAGSVQVVPLSINDSGQVVGHLIMEDGFSKAFLWSLSDGMRMLDDLVDPGLGIHFVNATAINDGGQIVAYTGEHHEPHTSYLLTPGHDHESLMAMLEAICQDVEQHPGRMQRKVPGVLTFGQCLSLMVKVEHAAAYTLEGRFSKAEHALVSFENEVRGFLRGGTLTPGQAHPLLVASKAIRNELSMAKVDGTTPDETPLPVAYRLGQNVPNPFNPTTKISFTAPGARDYTLTIYNVAGKAVRTFSGSVGAGPVEITWEGTDESGTRVGSGVYFYTVKAGDFRDTKKMVMLK